MPFAPPVPLATVANPAASTASTSAAATAWGDAGRPRPSVTSTIAAIPHMRRSIHADGGPFENAGGGGKGASARIGLDPRLLKPERARAERRPDEVASSSRVAFAPHGRHRRGGRGGLRRSGGAADRGRVPRRGG